jgi:hypothetical protein
MTQRYVHPGKESALSAVEKLNETAPERYNAVTNPNQVSPGSDLSN